MTASSTRDWYYQKTTLLGVHDEGPFAWSDLLKEVAHNNLKADTPIRSVTRTSNKWIRADSLPAIGNEIATHKSKEATRKRAEAATRADETARKKIIREVNAAEAKLRNRPAKPPRTWKDWPPPLKCKMMGFALLVLGIGLWFLLHGFLLAEAVGFGAILSGLALQIAGWFEWNRWRHLKFLIVASAIFCAAYWFFASTRTEYQHFTRGEGEFQSTINASHRIRRWNNSWLDGHCVINGPIVIEMGGLTSSGKRHGHWLSFGKGEFQGTELETWYWFDDEISEGEWHLRNK